MKSILTFTLVLAACSLVSPSAGAKEKKPAGPVGWAYASKGPIDVRPTLMNRNAPVLHLGRGAVVAILDAKEAAKTRVRAIDPVQMTPVVGLVDSSQIEKFPLDRFPSDQDLFKMLGGIYWDDVTTRNAQVARYLVKQGQEPPALICFIGAAILPQSRLQVFQAADGHYVPGPFIDFPTSEIKMAITSLEVQDLMGDGNECLITHEPFVVQTDNQGVNLIIRRIEGRNLKTLWRAPLEYKNTATYPPQIAKLTPLVENIGTPGTVAKGTVDFRPRGALKEPFWQGKVSFYVVGRDEALESVPVQKLCPWDGTKFAPLKKTP